MEGCVTAGTPRVNRLWLSLSPFFSRRRLILFLMLGRRGIVAGIWEGNLGRAQKAYGLEMTLDISRQSGEECRATSSLEVDFALVLASTIDMIRGDPAQLRSAVYQLARIRLQEEPFVRGASVGTQDIERLRTALETAIQGVETFALRKESRTLLPLPDVDQDNRTIGLRRPILSIDHSPMVPAESEHRPTSLFANHTKVRSQLGRLLILAAIGTALLYAMLGRHLGSASSNVQESASTMQVASVDPKLVEMRSPTGVIGQSETQRTRFFSDGEQGRLPLPQAYGVYAISDGQLHPLDVLPGRAPDPRVLISAAITKPSQTTLRNGRVQFVAYRRDLLTSAPDRVSVRVIAKIMRGMSFNTKGSADTIPLEDVWAIRNISHHFTVAPMPENSEMLVFRPEPSDFVFPAGRYALVLNGQAYDFTVAGTITEAAQCVERIEATNGTFYSECKRDQPGTLGDRSSVSSKHKKSDQSSRSGNSARN
jgi:hypothetical protein